jgi:hypothetical protein
MPSVERRRIVRKLGTSAKYRTGKSMTCPGDKERMKKYNERYDMEFADTIYVQSLYYRFSLSRSSPSLGQWQIFY